MSVWVVSVCIINIIITMYVFIVSVNEERTLYREHNYITYSINLSSFKQCCFVREGS